MHSMKWPSRSDGPLIATVATGQTGSSDRSLGGSCIGSRGVAWAETGLRRFWACAWASRSGA
eukprot:8885315-Alexandrium_andersonii.AAC.1